MDGLTRKSNLNIELKMNVEVRGGNIEGALKLLSRKLAKDGIHKTIRERTFNITRSERRKLKLRKACGRNLRNRARQLVNDKSP